MGILDIILEIIHHEFNDVISIKENNKISISNNNNNVNTNTAKLSASFFTELFSLLTSLFPDNDKNKRKENKR